MTRYSWNQNGPGSKSLSVGSARTCQLGCSDGGTEPYTYSCHPDRFYAVRAVPAHRRWQYGADENYLVEYSERHLRGRWIEDIGTARTQSEGKAIAEEHLEQKFGPS